jgi:peptide chain release factor 3
MRVLEEAMRRRTIAVISHPDAGKSTLTESLLLHADAVAEAGAVHGKATRRSTVSDWMEMEKTRGISVSSAALQFTVGDTVINLVDTPGHADFSEDTYRVLAAVDAAIMLIDAAKGMEAQTMRLFEVCAARQLPVIVMVNKWDRPGLEPLELMDELREVTGRQPMPLNWPVGEAGNFVGLYDVASEEVLTFSANLGNAHLPTVSRLHTSVAAPEAADALDTAIEEAALVALDGGQYAHKSFLDRTAMPVFFGAAVRNVGVGELLAFIRTAAPWASPRTDIEGRPRAVNADFSAQVFKVQANMDPAHRDRVAFMRVCSGTFSRGMTVTHARTGRPFATKYALQVFGRDRETVDNAYPGDVVGLVNAGLLRPGDTLYTADRVVFEGIPDFIPELFALASPADTATTKKFRKGIVELAEEGVVQLLHSERRGPQSPLVGAVGAMQFEVLAARMKTDFGAEINLHSLPYTVTCPVTSDLAQRLGTRRECEIVERAGQSFALFTDEWHARALRREFPELQLTTRRPPARRSRLEIKA